MEKCLFCCGVPCVKKSWRTPTCTECTEGLKNALRSRRDLWCAKVLGRNSSAFQCCIICGPRSRTGACAVGCIDEQRSVCQWCVTEQAANVQEGWGDKNRITWTSIESAEWASFLRKYDPRRSVKPAKKARICPELVTPLSATFSEASGPSSSSSNLGTLADTADIGSQQIEEPKKTDEELKVLQGQMCV